MTHTVAIAVLCIAVAGVGAQWVAWRLQLPAIVLLFAVGLIVGPGLEILRPATDLGPGLRPLIGLAVAIVVFEGGLALDFRELRHAGEGVARLTVVALPISFVLAAMAAYLVGQMGWRSSLLFGAITVVTGPTVVLPLLRNTRLERRTASFLKWEAIVNDPVGALLAAIVLALMLAGTDKAPGMIALELLEGLAVATGLGIGAALLVRWLVNRDMTPENLKTPILLALAMGVYVLSNLVMNEAGLAAATIFGIAIANLHVRGIGEIARFKESLVVLIVSALFVVLTANLDRSLFTQISWPIILLTLAMVFAVRPLAIFLATLRTDLTWQERALAGWIAPRGIVAAAVAGIASQRLSGAGLPGSQLVMPAVFALIAATMILHGFTLAPLARRLKLTLGDRPGLAIVGATPWTIALAKVLKEAGTPVLVIDIYPGALDNARREQIPIVQAEILSEHGEDELAGRRVDYVLAATQNDVYNSLVCAKLAPELGRSRVFQMAPAGGDVDEWVGLKREWRGILVGQPPLDFATARKRFRTGWTFVLKDLDDKEHLNDRDKDDSETGDDRQPEALGAADAVCLIVLRRNGGLAFPSVENAPLSRSAGDRALFFVEESDAAPASSRETVEAT